MKSVKKVILMAAVVIATSAAAAQAQWGWRGYRPVMSEAQAARIVARQELATRAEKYRLRAALDEQREHYAAQSARYYAPARRTTVVRERTLTVTAPGYAPAAVYVPPLPPLGSYIGPNHKGELKYDFDHPSGVEIKVKGGYVVEYDD